MSDILNFLVLISSIAILTSDLFLSKYVYFISIITVSLTAAYSFRLIYYVFHGSLKFSNAQYNKVKESSFYILLPLILLGFFAIFSGYLFKDYFISDKYVQLWINSNVANLSGVDLHHKNYLINFIPTIFAFFGIFLIFYLYFFKQNLILFLKKKFNLLYQFLLNKWYFDEFYNYLFVKNIIKLSENLWKKIDIGLIDRLGPNAIALSTKNISKFFIIFFIIIYWSERNFYKIVSKSPKFEKIAKFGKISKFEEKCQNLKIWELQLPQ